MRFDSMVKARFVHSIREPYSLLFVIFAIIVAIQAAFLAQGKVNNQLKVAIVLEDDGEMGEKMIQELSENSAFLMELMSHEDALRQLNRDQIEIVAVIRSDFSDSLKRGEFRNTIELYTSPSSQAPATVSEPLVNAVMMLWMEEYSVLQTKEYLQNRDILYGEREEEIQRKEIYELWDMGSMINVENINLDEEEIIETKNTPFSICIKWYGALCLFYLIVDASWVFDVNKKSLRMRMKQAGVKQWQMISYNSIVPILICLMGYLLTGLLCNVFFGSSIFDVLIFFGPMLIYLMSLMGITLLIASFFRNILSLMFLAPVLTFVNGVLCGLFLELPEWAYVLKQGSEILPGRILNTSFQFPEHYYFTATLCGMIWIIVGMGASRLREK